MDLRVVQTRKKQQKLTRSAFAVAVVFHAMLGYLFYTKVVPPAAKDPPVVVVTDDEKPLEPPVRPAVPPTRGLDLPDDVTIKLPDQPSPRPGDAPWRPGDFDGMGPGEDGDPQPPTRDPFAEAGFPPGGRLPPIDIPGIFGSKILGDPDPVDGPAIKSQVSGRGTRLSGRSAIAILDLPGTSQGNPWDGGELEAIADYVSRNTNLRVTLGARSISFSGHYACFDAWARSMSLRSVTRQREIGHVEPEIDALEALADAMPYAFEDAFEQYRQRVRSAASGYLAARFGIRPDMQDDARWSKLLVDQKLATAGQQEWLDGAQDAVKAVLTKARPSPDAARGLYLMLRAMEMQQLPVLFCEPRGVPELLHPESMRLLQSYVRNGGFIYLTNVSDLNRARAVRGLIAAIADDQLRDPEGEATLARMQADDQPVTGFVAREPEPRIAHPWVFFPLILPVKTDLSFTIYNRRGQEVYREQIPDVAPNTYLNKNRHFRWHMVDGQNNPLESGYYIYRIEAGLFRKTGALGISQLRLLPNGRHGVFSAYFNISEVPATSRARPEDLAYGQEGLFGVTLHGRLAIAYAEGYGEKNALRASDAAAREATLQWMANVVMFALSERAIARR